MKILFDTNVLISSVVSQGNCAEIVKTCVRKHELYTSSFILEEFRRILLRKFYLSSEQVDVFVRLFKRVHIIIKPILLEYSVSTDPDDDNILAAAVAGGVDVIVSGDQDLLVLKKFKSIPIIKPGDFWEFERSK